jgi:hypothetical protein
MDGPFAARVKAVVDELARERQAELAAGGTLVDLEKLTCEIGDVVTRELTQREVVRRAEALDAEEAECPDCGACCPRREPEPVLLAGLRGEIAYRQPSYFCRH